MFRLEIASPWGKAPLIQESIRDKYEFHFDKINDSFVAAYQSTIQLLIPPRRTRRSNRKIQPAFLHDIPACCDC
jgi:hypothetical protein